MRRVTGHKGKTRVKEDEANQAINKENRQGAKGSARIMKTISLSLKEGNKTTWRSDLSSFNESQIQHLLDQIDQVCSYLENEE